MRAARPTAGSTLSFFKLLLGSSDAAVAGRRLFRVFDPADELVAGQRRDVVPGLKCGRVTYERGTQVGRKLMDYTAGHCHSDHTPMLPSRTRITA